MTVIYIDVLFLINLFVNYFLLLSVKLITKSNARRFRILIGALTGAIYSCLMFYPVLQIIYSAIFKILFSFLTVLIAFGYKSLRSFGFKAVMFFTFTLLFGGIMLLIDIIFAPNGLIYNNGVVYIDISPVSLVLSCAICYLVFWLCLRIFSSVPTSKPHRITVSLFDKSVSFYALADSGNLLKDTLTLSSVIIADYSKISTIIPESCTQVFKYGSIQNIPDEISGRFALIPFNSIGGSGLIPAFRPDSILINGKKCDKKAVIAVEPNKFKTEDYSAIISPELI